MSAASRSQVITHFDAVAEPIPPNSCRVATCPAPLPSGPHDYPVTLFVTVGLTRKSLRETSRFCKAREAAAQTDDDAGEAHEGERIRIPRQKVQCLLNQMDP